MYVLNSLYGKWFEFDQCAKALLDTNAEGVIQIEHPLHLLINPSADYAGSTLNCMFHISSLHLGEISDKVSHFTGSMLLIKVFFAISFESENWKWCMDGVLTYWVSVRGNI